MQDAARGEKWIGHARLLAEVPSTSIEYCEVYKIPRVGFLRGPRVHCSYQPPSEDFRGEFFSTGLIDYIVSS